MKDNNNTQNRTTSSFTEKMAEHQAEIERLNRKQDIGLRNLFINRKKDGVDSKMFSDGGECVWFYSKKDVNHKKLCTLCFPIDSSCRRDFFPLYIGKRIRFYDNFSMRNDGYWPYYECIIRSVISNDENGLVLHFSKVNIIDRIFRRGKTHFCDF